MKWLLLLLLLAGCSQPQPGACVPKVVRIQLFGDSTQAGYFAALENDPSKMLQTALEARFGAGSAVVIQRGMSGTTVVDLVKAIGPAPLNSPMRFDLVDITVINYGINDQRYRVPIPIYKLWLYTFSPTVYETPNPVSGGSDEYARAMREVAGNRPVADVDAYVRSLPHWEKLLQDGVHPGADLYRMISANVLVPAVVPLVAKLRCQDT